MIYPLRHSDYFYPSFPSLFFYIPLARCESHHEGDDSLLWLLLITSHKIWLARDIISYSGTTADVFACTLLHHELQDYSLEQIAFAVFRALFAITQLLCHVSALLTSACKQAYVSHVLYYILNFETIALNK